MNQLANIFSVLGLDVEDDREQTAIADHLEKANGKGKEKKESPEDVALSVDCEQTMEVVSKAYKLPLVWIDLEMTARNSILNNSQYYIIQLLRLNVDVDRILEIACIITDGNLNKLVEGPHLIIHQSKDCMEKMGEWCETQHAASGLTEKVLQSTVSEQEAEMQVADFVKKYIGSRPPLLAGNSVYMDFIFLKKYISVLASLFSHVLVDVSSIRELCVRWYPKESKKAPLKKNKHRALDDIKESIAELKYFKESIFKSTKYRK